MNNQPNIAFIGAGSMAYAIISGLINNGTNPKKIWTSNRREERKNYLASQLNVQATNDNKLAAKQADIIILCVKPHQIESICTQLEPIIKENTPLIISVAAGTTLQSIASWTNKDCAIIRSMPNVASAVNASATGLVGNSCVTKHQKDQAESIFRSIGTTFWLDTEDALDAFTVIAGSGPAYCFYLYEAMQNAAESLGLPHDMAKLVVAETAVGAAKLALESTNHFHSLRQSVTSPNGATEAATTFLDTHDTLSTIHKAIHAAYKRTKEMAKE